MVYLILKILGLIISLILILLLIGIIELFILPFKYIFSIKKEDESIYFVNIYTFLRLAVIRFKIIDSEYELVIRILHMKILSIDSKRSNEKNKSNCVNKKESKTKNNDDKSSDDKVNKIKKRIVKLSRDIFAMSKLILSDEFSDARGMIIQFIVTILERVRPHKVNGYICFGFDSPENTGYLLAFLSLITVYDGVHLELVPYFDREVLSYNVKANGDFNLGLMILLFFKLKRNKNFNMAYKKVRSL